MNKVYIILVNYNGWKDSIECLESLFKLKYSNYEIVLVDNASTNDSVSKLLEWSAGRLKMPAENEKLAYLSEPRIEKPLNVNYLSESKGVTSVEGSCDFTLIEAKSNNGFSAGNNIGINYALQKGDAAYFWILNNDTVTLPNCLDVLVERYSSNSKIGILGAKVKYYYQPEMLQCAGGGTYFKWLAYSNQVGNQEIDTGQYDREDVELDLIIGACMFVSADFIRKVGLLSEDYFLYYEEQDWAERAKKQGYSLAYEPKAVIYHKEGQSIGGTQLDLKGISRLSDFYYARNKIILTKKHFSFFHLISVYLSFSLIAINRIRRGQANRIPMLIKILFNPNKSFEEK